jgi:hypothetical protein
MYLPLAIGLYGRFGEGAHLMTSTMATAMMKIYVGCLLLLFVVVRRAK